MIPCTSEPGSLSTKDSLRPIPMAIRSTDSAILSSHAGEGVRVSTHGDIAAATEHALGEKGRLGPSSDGLHGSADTHCGETFDMTDRPNKCHSTSNEPPEMILFILPLVPFPISCSQRYW